MTKNSIEIQLKKIAKKIAGKDYKLIALKISVNRNDNLSVSSASRDKDFGDYSSNVLFLLAKIKKITPQEAFELIKPRVAQIKSVKKVEFVNGFLNFFLDEKIFINDFKAISKNNISALINNPNSSKVILDYVSANPTGPLQLGNARGAVIGDCLAKILKLSGVKTTSEFYVNDRGFQIEILGKSALYFLKKLDNETVELSEFGLEENNFYRGDYLQKIVTERKNEIQKFKSLEFQKIGKFVADIIIDDLIKKSLKNFGVEFDNYFSETSLYNGNLCKKVLGLMKKKKIVCERDGATWLMLTKIGESKDEVIIKSSGEYTYFWSDILYHYHKFFIRKSSAILIVSADHLDHTRRLRIVFEKIFGIKPNMFNFIVYQMVHLVKGDELIRMSKRRGTYITLDDLVSEVGLDSVKFFFLKYSADTTVEFDLELAKKQSEENPIWYLHYGYVRLKKIIEKATANSLTLGHRLSPHSSDESQPLVSAVSPNTEQCSVFGPNQKTKIYFSSLKMINYFQHRLRQVPSGQLFALLNNQNYLLLFRKIHQFPDLLSEIVKDLRPNLLPQYLSELAKMIHSFYEQEPILKQKFPKQTKFVSGLKLNKVQFQQEIKLLFVNYLMRVLELGFYLIGVEPKNEL